MAYSLVLVFLNLLVCSMVLCTDICTTCQCTESSILDHLKDVDCSKMKFQTLPSVTTWPNYTLSLDVSFNNITSVEFNITYKWIATLKLNNNRIRVIHPLSFVGLSNLKTLDLSNNFLTVFHGNEFQGLGSLEELNIGNNKIEIIPATMFYNFAVVEEKSLNKNVIPEVQRKQSNLKRLDLSNIGAFALADYLFSRLTDLEFLDLSGNVFKEVPKEALRSAANLKWLRLNRNPIEELDKTSFGRLNALQVLEISNMGNLTFIGPEAFSDLSNLRVLDANWNSKLYHLDRDAFSGLFSHSENFIPALREVSFENARLRFLEERTFDCRAIHKLNLQGNPWYCDCGVQWIKRCPISSAYSADLRCDGPYKLKNSLIFEVDDDELKCETGPSGESLHSARVIHLFSLGLGLGCAFLIIFPVVVVLICKRKSIKTWWRLKRRGPGPIYYVRTKTYPTETWES